MAKDILFEIGTEEIPARFMPGALSQLAVNAGRGFAESRISHSGINVFGTPRRLTLVVKQAAETQADQTTRKKGPSVKLAFDSTGNPSKALQGFARSSGVTVEQLINEDGYMYAVLHETGKPAVDLLPELLVNLVESQNFPKNMRWGDSDFRFVRPIHWLVALFGNETVPVFIAGIRSGRISKGHRILGLDRVEISDVADYLGKMADNFVIVDPDVRRGMIRQQVEALALEQGGTATIDDELLEEVLYLVEYPTALCGRFEEKYLELPVEAIITPMREHQRYFPVFSAGGKLLPVFITVRNGGTEFIDNVRHGNERVLRARLADAKFFFDEDRKVPLADRVEKLKTIVFQEGLGTMFDKVLRLQKLSLFIAGQLGIDGKEAAVVERTALLAKADLVTGMVCEFTELQGVMGREYAKLSGETTEVADAIFEHYLPRFAGDILPRTSAGRIVSIADKIDNILTTFSRGKIPTGSQDPYALRRQALGIVNILIDGKISLSLRGLFLAAFDLVGIMDVDKRNEISAALSDFFRQRLNARNVLGDAGIRYDIIDALLETDTDDIYQTWLRALAMASEEGTEAMEQAVEAFTRAANLSGKTHNEKIDPALFEVDAERKLYQALQKAMKMIEVSCADRNYVSVLKEIAELSMPIDNFFSEVMVMVEDAKIRENRLALLRVICGLTHDIADFSKIVAKK